MFDYYHENLVDMSHNNEKHNVKSWRQQKLDSGGLAETRLMIYETMSIMVLTVVLA